MTILILAVVALAPFGLALARRRPALLVAAALLVLPLPLALPLSHTILRFGALILTFLMLIKSVQIATGDVRPRSWVDTVQFFTILAVADWDAPRRPSVAGAARRLGIGLGQLGLFGAVVLAGRTFRPDGPLEIVLKELALYLALSSAANAGVFHLDLRGVPYLAPFHWPLLARTPSDFWGCRWNSWVSHILYRYAFLPAGGRRHPMRGTLAAFGLSAALHEALVSLALWRLTGWTAAFFLLQGLLVIASSRGGFSRFARRRPWVAWAITLTLLLVTGALFIRGIDPIIEP